MNHITTKFERTLATFGIEDEPQMAELAEAFYDAGISAALQQSNCKEAVLTHGYSTKHEPMFLDVDRCKVNGPELTQAQIQFLSSVLNRILNSFEESKIVMKRNINMLWDESDPGDPETADNYRALNKWKNHLRELKLTYNRMAATQRILKKMQKKA